MKIELRKHTTEIILHHSISKTGTTVEEIDKWHREKGYGGIGYQEVIREVSPGLWDFEAGRHLMAVGAHCLGGFNYTSVGICVCGDFDKMGVPESLLSLLCERFAVHCTYFDIPLHRIYLHCEVDNRTCPGKNMTVKKPLMIERTRLLVPLRDSGRLILKGS
jgi:hypothetical protein